METLVLAGYRLPVDADRFVLPLHQKIFMNFSPLDWTVLIGTLTIIIIYGVFRSRTSKNLDGYFLSDRQMPWYIVLLSVMGTQASAITFLTAPGQAYSDGMRFVQYYFGLPLAMIIICISFVPIYRRLKCYTAYEYLETRFDVKTRALTAFLFMLSRGLSTGISVIAPSIVLHSMLGWDIGITNIFMGGLLIIYTVAGGSKAVAYTQSLQFVIIYGGMFIAAWWALKLLPDGVSLTDALHISGKSGKVNVFTSGFTEKGFDWKDRYNIFSGVIGGLFLALSYFGTDQSQVGRYLTARTEKESKLGLIMNGFIKVPLQFSIMIIGLFVFAFYQFHKAPAWFNLAEEANVKSSVYAGEYAAASDRYALIQEQKKLAAIQLTDAMHKDDEVTVASMRDQMHRLDAESKKVRIEVRDIVAKANPGPQPNDNNYIFLRFVGDFLPNGLVGLIIAIIFLASWGSIAAALNSLASTTMVDFHKKISKKELTPLQEYRWSKGYTFIWAIFCIVVAQFANNIGNSLIEGVNILGSWFYGTILGVFLVAFYMKRIRGSAVFYAAIMAEAVVIIVYRMDVIGFLWLTAVGAVAVILFGWLLQLFVFRKPVQQAG
jgi:solute:Na+ symporter, SSS family